MFRFLPPCVLVLAVSQPIFSERILTNRQELVLVSKFLINQNAIPEISAYGEKSFTKIRFSPASTFKTYLALSLLENRIVDPEVRILCSDSHIPGSPRNLNLREALFYSSNDYFSILFPKLGRKKLEKTLRRIGYGPLVDKPDPSKKGKLPETWWTDEKGLKHGGVLRLFPEEIHGFWVAVFWRRDLGISESIYRSWISSLFWSDCPERSGTIFGKTGSWEGNYWFQGILISKNGPDSVAVTVLNKFKDANRTATINRFYEIVGCKMPLTEDRGQRTEDRGQRTEDRGQRTEDRGQRTEDRGQRTEDRGQRTEDRGQRTEDRGQRTEDRGQRIIPITLTTIFLKTNYVGARCYWIFGERQQFCVNDDF
ncbi:penicillin-binding protein, transpeptidase domain protein [Leptospira inadai serovar Lyme str. 10]|uniref:Penicillin-binding protein, transpeptidase domain protein n=1 Tax=Leptospira inadai serovar Lyme str. 10 TaxID=1049790 RepID=V6H954_9LEPT|nr:penicillin-binding transpeptidase domain-containing protein [Leptospira inadai]EQA35402.1 penicillin-binding protein, transpeptidase domain protein [Leptospira inadai serovar Lyme str. 10]